MVARPEVRAWRPPVRGIVEVFHASFTDHSYPMHTHDSWTLLLVDDGMVRYDLDRHEHGALNHLVTLLPPHVPHNGSPATSHGFRKRVLYLDTTILSESLAGIAVDSPALNDPGLRRQIHTLHTALEVPGAELAAESLLALIRERLRGHLRQEPVPAVSGSDSRGLAHRLRDLLNDRYVGGISLDEAAGLLHAHPTHLIRAFSREFGMAPHQYLTGRRIDLARHLLLEGLPARHVAAASGFYDQSHLTRHFKKVLGTTPGRYRVR
jgi:AraC-like DNA-binding protein